MAASPHLSLSTIAISIQNEEHMYICTVTSLYFFLSVCKYTLVINDCNMEAVHAT